VMLTDPVGAGNPGVVITHHRTLAWAISAWFVMCARA